MSARSDRLRSLDIARGAALLVVAAAHAPTHLRVADSEARPVDGAAAFVSTVFVEGRGYPVFGAVFGYSLVEFARSRPPEAVPDTATLLRHRGAWLIVVGAVHAATLWSGDILGAYGVLLLSAAPAMLSCRDRTLVALAVGSLAIVGVGGAAMASSGPELAGTLRVTGRRARMSEWLPTLVLQPLGLLGAAAVGVLGARHRVLDDSPVHRRRLTGVTVCGVTLATVGALPRLLVGRRGSVGRRAAAGALHSVTGYGGLGYGAGLALIAPRSGSAGILTRAVAATGQRSLSAYLAQSALFAVAASPRGGRLAGRVGMAGALLVAGAVWATTVAASDILRARGARGPAEAVLRRLVAWSTGKTAGDPSRATSARRSHAPAFDKAANDG